MISSVGLVLAFACAGTPLSAALITFWCSFGLFFVSSPQQLLMVRVGRGGGEMIGSACVQVAFNLGNAFGAAIGQAVLNAGASYAEPSLAGVSFALAAVCLLVVFSVRYEKRCSEEAPEASLAAGATSQSQAESTLA